MFRWLGIAIAVAATILAACGRQLTGLSAPGAGLIQSGHMLIRFRVAGPLDFTNVQYFILFNTNGNGREPYPSGLLSGLTNYSFALVVGGSPSLSQPLLFQYYLAPGAALIGTFKTIIPPQYISYVPNSGGNPSGGGEFTVNFDRRLLYGQNLTGAPTPVASASAAATTAPLASPTPAPTFTLNPNVQPTTAAQHMWAINFITTDTNNVPIDSMGPFGPTDTTFAVGIFDTTKSFDFPYVKPVGTSTVQNLGAQLQSFEVINAP